MNRKKAFCEQCRDEVEYTITSVPMVGTIKGKEYRYSMPLTAEFSPQAKKPSTTA